ncbi:hypothetical protein QR674_05685 [Acinetobacter chinensis]|uniref:Uncharacterized protein n=1 Tax=Acinetobacter chinensis TaxID=2004650 RepID=A0ABU3WDJ4_9GAMM|nr:hypothetical protein [Acinetobacter chinensis]MDV2468470.1 hypothetical protein [Acinetobacter chinensis]
MNFIEAMDLFKTGDLGDCGKVEDILESEDYIVELILKPDNYLGCEAFFVSLGEDYRIPQKYSEQGYEIILDIQDIKMLADMADEYIMSDETFCELIIHYYLRDAFPSWLYDLPEKQVE